MPRIIIDDEKLAKRGKNINSLLSSLLRKSTGSNVLAYDKWPLSYGTLAIAAFQGKQTLNFNDARFNTFLENFQAQYFEVWIPVDVKKMGEWYLSKAYLNIYKGIKEYICLHCDPEEEDDHGTKGRYKRSPHIHLKIEHHCISKSHIALAHGYLDKIYISDSELFTAIGYGVELISDEVLGKYEE